MPPDMLQAMRRTLRRVAKAGKRWHSANPRPPREETEERVFKRPKRLDGHKPIAPLRVVPNGKPREAA